MPDFYTVPAIKETKDQLEGRSSSKANGSAAAAGSSSSSSGGKQGLSSEILAQMMAKRPHHIAVHADYAKRGPDIGDWAQDVEDFESENDEAKCVQFVEDIERKLGSLYDSTAELRLFGKWPQLKWEALLESVARLR
jgi:hypothetical protein